MRRRALTVVTALLVLANLIALPAGSVRAAETDFARYVDPMIGTYPPGFVNPGPALPHGMVGLGPDTEGPFNYGGYHYVNNTITGFSHIHMSAGVPRGGQIPVMPVSGPVQLQTAPIPEAAPLPGYSSPFSHARETAQAGYYRVELLRYGITAELTATERVGMHRYTFPPGAPASIVLDIGRDLKGTQSSSVQIADGVVSGHVTAEMGIDVYFAAAFDRDFTGRTFVGTAVSDAQAAEGNRAGAIVDFGTGGGVVQAKVGISFVDVEGALANLKAEIPDWDFDRVRAEAQAIWNDALGRIEVSGGTTQDLTSFYTALYHAQLFPNLFSDIDGRYVGFDDVIRTSERPRYTQFSLWDSYRGQNQLLAVIDPDAYRDMITSLLDMYRESGKLPRWTFANRDPAHMSGDPVIPFIGEGWCRGLVDASLQEELYGAMVSLATSRGSSYDDLGFAPTRKPAHLGEVLAGGPREAGTTLEYGLADFALALMAETLDKEGDQELLTKRATYYRNLLDPETDWIRPRHADGSWLREFVAENGYGFQEGTSWQYSWLAMQDLRGLFDGMGGNDVVNRRLDVFFNLPVTGTVPVVWPKAQNQATLFGLEYRGNQYAPGNEHDLQAPFLYNYAGAPWKTQAVARGVASLFTPTPDGLPGNDDLGALSGWLVWTMLGLYPMTPGAPLYTIASPVFERAVVHRPGTSDLVIEAPGASATNKYVGSATLDDQPLERTWFAEEDGNVLSLRMSPLPDTSWGALPEAAPPSLSTHGVDAFGCRAGDEADPIATTLTYVGDTTGRGTTVRVAALLEDANGTPLAGRSVTFAIDGQSLTAITGADGIADTSATVAGHGRSVIVAVDFAGDERHLPSHTEATITWGRGP